MDGEFGCVARPSVVVVIAVVEQRGGRDMFVYGEKKAVRDGIEFFF